MFTSLIHQHLIPFVDTKRLTHSLGQVKALLTKQDKLKSMGINLSQVLAYGFLLENELIQRGEKYNKKTLETHVVYDTLLIPTIQKTVSFNEINSYLKLNAVFKEHTPYNLFHQIDNVADKYDKPAFDFDTWDDLKDAFEKHEITVYNGTFCGVTPNKEYLTAEPCKTNNNKGE